MSDFRPRSAAEIADAAIQLTRRHYGAMLPLAALLSIPSVLLNLLTVRAQPLDGTAPDPGQLAGVLVPSLLAMLWWSVSSGALVAVAAACYLGEPLDPWDGARRAFRRAGALIGSTIGAWMLVTLAFVAVAAALAVVGGIVAAVTGGGAMLGSGSSVVTLLVLAALLSAMLWPLLLLARYVIATPVVMIEGAGAGEALRRATALGEGRLWRSLGLLAVAMVLLVGTMLTALGIASLAFSNQQVASIVAGIAMVPLYPAWACLLVVLYYDLRIRKEGYDLELMARAMGGDPAPAPAGAGATGAAGANGATPPPGHALGGATAPAAPAGGAEH